MAKEKLRLQPFEKPEFNRMEFQELVYNECHQGPDPRYARSLAGVVCISVVGSSHTQSVPFAGSAQVGRTESRNHEEVTLPREDSDVVRRSALAAARPGFED